MNKNIHHLHYISQSTEEHTHQDLILEALKGGVKWIQLRIKETPKDEVLRIAQEVRKLCTQYNAQLILNDHVQIAKEIKADGVHLGLTDVSTKEARKILGEEVIIGGTANTLEDIIYHYENGVDYVGVGPYRFTSTKKNLSPIVGLEGYKQLIQELKDREIKLPLIAIGGIDQADFSLLKEVGVHGIALASLINLNGNPQVKALEIVQAIEETWKN